MGKQTGQSVLAVIEAAGLVIITVATVIALGQEVLAMWRAT